MTLFDAYVMVDWTSSSVPKGGKDSIWVGIAERSGRSATLEKPTNPRTRAAAEMLVRERLRKYVAAGVPALVGFDFPYGYAQGFASACGLSPGLAPWRATWARLAESIRDDERNQNNRFEVASDLNESLGATPGPFWGCPKSRQTKTLLSTGASYPYRTRGIPLERKRIAEQRLRGVQEAWKLYGNGSVGSQALVGIPRVAALRDDAELAPHSRVWPFETGFTAQPSPSHGPFVLHAEIWPGVVPIDGSLHSVRDAAQVLTLARHFALLDERGELGALFAPPRGLDSTDLEACVGEEGWILGA